MATTGGIEKQTDLHCDRIATVYWEWPIECGMWTIGRISQPLTMNSNILNTKCIEIINLIPIIGESTWEHRRLHALAPGKYIVIARQSQTKTQSIECLMYQFIDNVFLDNLF